MKLEDVDVIRAEAFEAGVEILAEATGDVAGGLVVVIRHHRPIGLVDVVAELRGDDDVVAALPEGFAEQSLAVPGAVVGGGVEERDAEIERPLEGAADSWSSTLLHPAGAPLKLHGPPMAQQPIPRALTSMPDRPRTRVKEAVMGATIWRVAVVRKCDRSRLAEPWRSTDRSQRPQCRINAEAAEKALPGRADAADGTADLVADLPIGQRLVALEEEEHPPVLGVEPGQRRPDAVGDFAALGAHRLVFRRCVGRVVVVELGGHQPGATPADL